MACSSLSLTPSARMKRLFGIHITPPEIEVVPPTMSVFSRTTALLPALRIISAAHIEPPPLPTITKSKLSLIRSSPLAGFALPVDLRATSALSQLGLARVDRHGCNVHIGWEIDQRAEYAGDRSDVGYGPLAQIKATGQIVSAEPHRDVRIIGPLLRVNHHLAGANGGDSNAVWLKLQVHALRKALQASLGGLIEAEHRVRQLHGLARYVDDMGAFAHHRHGGTRAEDRARKIGGNGSPDLRIGRFDDGERLVNGSIVDQDVDLRMAFGKGGKGAAHRIRRAHIAFERHGRAA